MLDKKYLNSNICNEFDKPNLEYWFDFKQKKFLHNIDTFYYSVKLENDFLRDSRDFNVINFRKFFDKLYSKQDSYDGVTPLDIDPRIQLIVRPFSFAGFYKINIECPDMFDIFIAPVIPPSGDGKVSLTCEIVVQIRSYMLWVYGVHESYERSLEAVKLICSHFNLDISYCQENRIDYCWHSNYLKNPEKFFSIDNFAKMRVSRINSATFHVDFKGQDDYEVDYLRLGERGSKKCFIRIYLKSKEVVEMGYKAFFFKVWLFHGLINRFDMYVLEECYKRKSWQYLDKARLQFYSEFGKDDFHKQRCLAILNDSLKLDYDDLKKYADSLVPEINLVMNVEYQTMRKATKTYSLLPLKDNGDKDISKRIYDYLDNRPLIIKYLTHDTLRLVDPNDTDTNKSRRDYCGFWKALRNTRLVDMKIPNKELKLVRDYSRNLNREAIKRRMLNQVITYGLYSRGINDDNVVFDCTEALCRLNDNDIKNMKHYKEKKTKQLNRDELLGQLEDSSLTQYHIVDESGLLIDDYKLNSIISQN